MTNDTSGEPRLLNAADILKITDMMLEWSQINDIPLERLTSNRQLILSRFRAGERLAVKLFGDL